AGAGGGALAGAVAATAGAGTAGAAAAAGGLLAALAALPAAAVAAVVVAVVAVAATVVVVAQAVGGGAPTAEQPFPTSSTSSPAEQGVPDPAVSSQVQAGAAPTPEATLPAPAVPTGSPSAAPAASPDPVRPVVEPTPVANPTPVATSTPAPAPAQVVVDTSGGGLSLTAGLDDQTLTFGIANVGGRASTAVTADVVLPAGVNLTGLLEGNIIASGGAAVPAASASWVCVHGSGDVAARCTVGSLAPGVRTELVLHVSVDELYEAADGTVGLRFEGADAPASVSSLPVAIAPAPARIALRGSVPTVALVVGRSRQLSVEVANEGAVGTTHSAPARVEVALPSGVRSTTSTSGPWSCTPGTGTIVCTAVLPGRSTSTLRLDLVVGSGGAEVTGTVGLSFGPTRRAGSALVQYSVSTPAHLLVATPAELGALALGTSTAVPVTVTNTGSLAAGQTTLTLTRPSGAAWAGVATGDGWSCQVTDELQVCTRDGLAPQARASLDVPLTAAAGQFGRLGELSVAAGADDADVDEAATLALTARAPVVAVGTTGARLLLTDGEAGTATFSVDVAAGAAASGVVATLALPAGIAYVADAGAQTPGCAQGAGPRQVVCDLGLLDAGTSTQVLVHVKAAGAVTAATGISVVADGGITAHGSLPVVASSGGLVPQVSFTGDVHVTQVGAPLLSCVTSARCTSIVRDGTADNNGLTMTPLDDNPPTDVTRPTTRANSSTTTLAVPGGAPVLWAGLYWSADAAASDTWSTDRTKVLLAGPGAAYSPVAGAVIADKTDNAGRDYYQSYADVTELVRTGGAGAWSVADAAVATPGTQDGGTANYYAGWSLVVVYGTEAAVETGARSVTVYDGGTWSGTSSAAPVFEFTAETGTRATVGVVAWEGDRTATGDRLLLNGSALTPVGWDGSAGRSTNAFDSTATGWRFQNSLGVDAKAFAPVTMTSDLGSLSATTTGDQYLLGVVTVESELPATP
ncbi:MAG: hypothetical protein L6311_03940, partial [Cellulomonas sp.]|nr:hypothetical protein [Cellulomonas sp.]